MNLFFLGCLLLVVASTNANAIPSWYVQFTAARPNDATSKKVCGKPAEDFIQWFCNDKTFTLPYGHHLTAGEYLK